MIIDELKSLNTQLAQLRYLEQSVKQNEQTIYKLRENIKNFRSPNTQRYEEQKSAYCQNGVLHTIGRFVPWIVIALYLIIATIIVATTKPFDFTLLFGAILAGVIIVAPCAFVLYLFFIVIDKWFRWIRERRYDARNAEEYNQAVSLDQNAYTSATYNANATITSLIQSNTQNEETISVLKKEIKKNRCVPDTYKTTECLNTLIAYFEQGRVDTLKEAFNLYVTETKYQQALNEQRQFNSQLQAQQAQMRAQMQSQTQFTQQALGELKAIAKSAEEARIAAEKARKEAKFSTVIEPSHQMSRFELESTIESAIRNSK